MPELTLGSQSSIFAVDAEKYMTFSFLVAFARRASRYTSALRLLRPSSEPSNRMPIDWATDSIARGSTSSTLSLVAM